MHIIFVVKCKLHLYIPTKEKANAVYGYFAGEDGVPGGVSIAVEKGDMKTLHQLQDRHEKDDRQEDGKNSDVV